MSKQKRQAVPTITIKPTEATQERIAKLVKKTGITRHNILLRLINLGLAQVEQDMNALFTPDAIGTDIEDGSQIESTRSIAA